LRILEEQANHSQQQGKDVVSLEEEIRYLREENAAKSALVKDAEVLQQQLEEKQKK